MRLCECNCGQPAPIATKTITSMGWKKGEPKRFISGHNSKGPFNPRWRPLEDRFWNRVDKTNGVVPAHRPEIGRCWPWVGFADKDGRGHIKFMGKYESAPRVAFFLTYGHWPTPQGLHKCDVPACCNPLHIFEGTQPDNIRDMVNKGRQSGVENNKNSRRLSDQDIVAIRGLCSVGKQTQKQIAAQFGISQSSVSNINTGVTWVGTNV